VKAALPTTPTEAMVDGAAALLWDHVAGTQGWGMDWATAKAEQPEMADACRDDARRYVAGALDAHFAAVAS
jgi:hypothetical protein